jgi:hypothetical protein
MLKLLPCIFGKQNISKYVNKVYLSITMGRWDGTSPNLCLYIGLLTEKRPKEYI